MVLFHSFYCPLKGSDHDSASTCLIVYPTTANGEMKLDMVKKELVLFQFAPDDEEGNGAVSDTEIDQQTFSQDTQ